MDIEQSLTTLHGLIAEKKDTIVARFVAIVRASLAPPGSSAVVIVNHIPQFLDALVEAMSSPPPRGQRSTLPVMREPARDHGLQRLENGFALDQVVREYSALRHIILELAEESNVAVTPREYDVFGQAISSGVLAAVVQYTDERTRELEIERRRLQTILSILPVGVFVNDTKGRILDINDAAKRIWGNPPAIDSWGNVTLYRGFHVDTGARVAPEEWPLSRSLFHGETVHEFEVEIETFDTRERKTLFVSSAPIDAEDGSRIGAVTVCLDITSRVRRLNETAEALRARDEVMNIVSHDLRNPLGAIRLSAQRLLRVADRGQPLKPEDVAPAVQNITRSSERMERLLNDLLDVARIEGGRFSIAPAAFDLAPAVRDVTDLVRPLADAKHIVIDVQDVDKVSGSIVADRERVLQVLSNLVGNAIKFTPDGGVVTIGAIERDGEIEIAVSDTGPGVPPSLQSKIWDRFFTTQGQRRLGTGLGLAIVKGIVEEHGGRVWLESQPGLGASFRFTLPRLPRKPASQPT